MKKNEVRLKEKSMVLSNQSIVELGYIAADLIKPLADAGAKLLFEQANCYLSVFYLVRKLLKSVDPEYLESHQRVRDFYDQEMSNDFDRLELPKTEKKYAICFSCGQFAYRIPGHRHDDGQVDTDENPVWLLESEEDIGEFGPPSVFSCGCLSQEELVTAGKND